MGHETIGLFFLYEIFSADCHISKTMHTCASPFVGVMAELSKPMTAMLHPLLSCTFKFSEIFDGCVPSSLASQVCNPAPPVKLVQLAKLVSAESAIRPMSIVHESLELLKATGALLRSSTDCDRRAWVDHVNAWMRVPMHGSWVRVRGAARSGAVPHTLGSVKSTEFV